jgi:hypothetical protein
MEMAQRGLDQRDCKDHQEERSIATNAAPKGCATDNL